MSGSTPLAGLLKRAPVGVGLAVANSLIPASLLDAFGKVGTPNLLIVAGALGLMPLQSLDAERRWSKSC
jgi:hypothetical protein